MSGRWAKRVSATSSDKLVTIDADPKSKTYGKVVSSVSVGGRGEAHHMGFTDDRKYLWAGRLDDSKIFIFDVGTDPSKPRLVNTITDFAEKTGFVGPHTFYAIPGRMVIGALSNDKTRDGVTGLAVYNNKGEFLSAHPIPADNGGDGYGYDIAINPKKNVFLTSSFTGWNNYMMDLGKLIKDAEAMKHFGNTMVLWNLKSMQPEKIFSVPGAPLEIRWSLKEDDDWAITSSALTSKLWLINHDANNEWQAKEVATIGDPAKIPLPVDISISADAKTLWVNTFMDGTTHLFDISDPTKPVQIYEKVTGKQVNMISQSWDGKRVYITSSLLVELGQEGRRQRAGPARLRLGRQGFEAQIRGRFFCRKARPPASHEIFGSARESLARHAGPRGIAVTMRATGARLFRPC